MYLKKKLKNQSDAQQLQCWLVWTWWGGPISTLQVRQNDCVLTTIKTNFTNILLQNVPFCSRLSVTTSRLAFWAQQNIWTKKITSICSHVQPLKSSFSHFGRTLPSVKDEFLLLYSPSSWAQNIQSSGEECNNDPLLRKHQFWDQIFSANSSNPICSERCSCWRTPL